MAVLVDLLWLMVEALEAGGGGFVPGGFRVGGPAVCEGFVTRVGVCDGGPVACVEVVCGGLTGGVGGPELCRTEIEKLEIWFSLFPHETARGS